MDWVLIIGASAAAIALWLGRTATSSTMAQVWTSTYIAGLVTALRSTTAQKYLKLGMTKAGLSEDKLPYAEGAAAFGLSAGFMTLARMTA